MNKDSDNICDFIEPLNDRAFEKEWTRLQSFQHMEKPLRAELRNLMRRAARAGMYETDFIDLLFEAIIKDFRLEHPVTRPKDRERMKREMTTFQFMRADLASEIKMYKNALKRFPSGSDHDDKISPPPIPLRADKTSQDDDQP